MTQASKNSLNEWITQAPLMPMPLSEERVQFLLSASFCQIEQGTEGPIYHWLPESAEDVADCLNLVSNRKWRATIGAKSNQLGSNHEVTLDLSNLNQVRGLHLEDTAITVETGMTWGQLQAVLAEHGRWVPLSYPPETLVLDIVANDWPALETGSMNYPGGYIRDYVLGVELATTDGRLNRYGGLVVKNATGYDLNKLYIGSQHAFGILTSVTLKIFQKPRYEALYYVPFEFGENIKEIIGAL